MINEKLVGDKKGRLATIMAATLGALPVKPKYAPTRWGGLVRKSVALQRSRQNAPAYKQGRQACERRKRQRLVNWTPFT